MTRTEWSKRQWNLVDYELSLNRGSCFDRLILGTDLVIVMLLWSKLWAVTGPVYRMKVSAPENSLFCSDPPWLWHIPNHGDWYGSSGMQISAKISLYLWTALDPARSDGTFNMAFVYLGRWGVVCAPQKIQYRPRLISLQIASNVALESHLSSFKSKWDSRSHYDTISLMKWYVFLHSSTLLWGLQKGMRDTLRAKSSTSTSHQIPT